MFIDIVIPEKNEKGFIKTAKAIGTKGICFLYREDNYKNGNKIIKRLKSDFNEAKDIEVYSGILLEKKNIKKAGELRKKLKPDLIASDVGERNELNNKIDILFELENQHNDFMKFRNSGLDFVKAKIMNKNRILLGLSFNLLLNSKQRNRIIGRLTQNIKICRKKSVDLVIASFARSVGEMRSEKELKALLLLLRASTEQTKGAGDNLYNRIILNAKINSGRILEMGVEKLSEGEINKLKRRSELRRREIGANKQKERIKKGKTGKKVKNKKGDTRIKSNKRLVSNKVKKTKEKTKDKADSKIKNNRTNNKVKNRRSKKQKGK